MGNNIILETKFVADIRGSFYIPSYQRGYRWSETEVVRLLDDIYQNGKKNYCLQPVVVRKKEDQYELIDGQQRLTTLYLIYKYMKNVNPFFNEPAFTLSYQTRDQSEEFLKTLDMTKQDDNIDFWFISKAYNTIKEWFEQDLQIRVMHIFEYLKEDVKIIWYEVGESEDAISLFTRLNIGKIPLTSAELVKAMFLSRDNAENMRREKQEEISLQWDGIERELHNESLWFFLTNSVKGEYQTRIDLVLDLIAGKDESTREKYYTFFRFDELRKEVSLDDIWKKIYQTFLTLKGWYEDHDLYHRIGYLITSGTSLHKIFALSKDKKKSEFNESLDELIKKSVAISGNYAELSYEKPLDYKRISTLLLLFNIESVRRSDGHAQRFPFDQFKHHKGSNVTWSLEHIHAQQSEGMKTQDVWKKWLELHIPSVESIGGEHSELIDEMQGAINADKLERTVFESIQQKVLGLLSVSGNTEYMFSVMQTKTQWSQNTYMPYLKEADDAHLSRDEMGQYLVYDDVYIVCENNSYKFLPQITLHAALISEIIQRSINLLQPINPAQVIFLLGCWPFLITTNHFKPFFFRPEQTFHLNSKIRLVVGQSLHELHILVSGQEDLTDSLNVLLLNTRCRHELLRYVRLYICQHLRHRGFLSSISHKNPPFQDATFPYLSSGQNV